MKIQKLFVCALVGIFIFTSSTVFAQGVMIEPGFAPVGGGVSSPGGVSSFSDVKQYHNNYQAIDYLRSKGAVVGYKDGTYGEAKNINRAEFLKIVMEASEYDLAGSKEDRSNCFKDVANDWYAPYVCKAKKLGLIHGYSDETFRPANDINFAEASKIVVNILDLQPSTKASKTWFEQFVVALDAAHAVPGNVNGFDKKVTRADMAEMIWRLETETTYKVSNSYENISKGVAVLEYGRPLDTFESCKELKKYYENNESGGNYRVMMMDMAVEESMPTAAPMAESAKAADVGLGGGIDGAVESSSTNVQVEGVDEADIVKNDNRYIYSLKGGTVRITDAYPPENMKELSKVSFDKDGFYPMDMYVDGDRLIVIGYSYGGLLEDNKSASNFKMMVEDYGYFSNTTDVYIFDISDKTSVSQLRKLSFEGDYSSSRKVGSTVYLVANKSNPYRVWAEEVADEAVLMPLYLDSTGNKIEPIAACDDVMYMPGVIEKTSQMIVAAIPVDDPAKEISEQVVVGSSGNIYASMKNLYIAEPKYSNWWWYEDSGNDEKTYIHKFGLDGVNVDYKGMGETPGTILNQFSMDENGEYFRIATTVGDTWNEKNPSTNNLYILDSGLNRVGSLEGLAPGEKIYSVRFVGDRAYIVTFKNTDPLFVIDVSTPSNPNVLGQLKIPGYSDYLHPYDENHLIGVGKDAIEDLGDGKLRSAGGFAWYQGMKLAIFDVTDVANPLEMHKISIGDRGTTSPLLNNHKALLFDKNKGFIAFPVTLHEISAAEKAKSDGEPSAYGDPVYQGAYIYNIGLEKGFELRGRITHYDENEIKDKAGYWWEGEKDVDRILYIGNYFYTVSENSVMANKMDDLVEAGRVELAE